MKIKKHISFGALIKEIGEFFNKIPDWRQENKVKIDIHDAMMSGVACMYFQDPSLLQFQRHLQDAEHRNNLMTLFGITNIPKESQMREIIDGVQSDYFRPIFKHIYLQLQRGKQLERYQIFPGIYYCPIDVSEFYSSQEVHCDQCLTKEHKAGSKTYSHYVLQGGIMHPDCSEVIPFMPEQIVNKDGETKQDCEMNAAKRFIVKLRQECPHLGLLIGGDALFSKQPIIKDVLNQGMHYLFGAKPDDHKYMMDWLNGYDQLNQKKFIDKEGRVHFYEWMNDVPLTGQKDSVRVNYFRCLISPRKNKKGEEVKVPYQNSWVTDILISEENITTLVKAGRCRWKNENECFNVLKNQGYFMEHNYGHGQKNLAFNFYLMTLLAFFFHQIFEFSDDLYKACRKKFGSKKNLWNTLRSYIKILVFDSWEDLLNFALNPKSYVITLRNNSP